LAIDRIDEAVQLLASADALRKSHRHVHAIDAACRALEILRSECGTDHPDVANALLTMGRIHQDIEAYADAEQAYLQASEIMKAWKDEPDEVVQRLRIQTDIAVGHIERMLGRLDEAYAILSRVVADAESRLGDCDPDTGSALNALGIACKYAGRFDEGHVAYQRALAIVERTAGPHSPAAASIWHNLGGLAFDAGDYAAAEPPARRAVEIREVALGPEHPDVAADLLALAPVLDGLGHAGEAANMYARARAILERLGDRDYDLAVLHNNLGVAATERGEPDTARIHYTTALAIKERLLGINHADLALTLHNLGVLVSENGRPDEARALLGRALGIFEASLPAKHPKIVTCQAGAERQN